MQGLWMLLLMVGPLLLGLWAQWRVKSAYSRAQTVPAAGGLTGAETAAAIMQAHGINGVRVEATPGQLSDHYDPRGKVLRLSEANFHGRSVAAAGIAAHEAGHAIQDAQRYGPLMLRNGIVPFAAVGSNMGMMLIIGGMVMGAAATQIGTWLFLGGIGLFSLVVLFQLINLPVEYDASRRAKDLLQSTGLIAQGEQAAAMNSMLSAAALTYVAATVGAAATLLYYILMFMSSQNRR